MSYKTVMQFFLSKVNVVVPPGTDTYGLKGTLAHHPALGGEVTHGSYLTGKVVYTSRLTGTLNYGPPK